jgi:hypothetical protein
VKDADPMAMGRELKSADFDAALRDIRSESCPVFFSERRDAGKESVSENPMLGIASQISLKLRVIQSQGKAGPSPTRQAGLLRILSEQESRSDLNVPATRCLMPTPRKGPFWTLSRAGWTLVQTMRVHLLAVSFTSVCLLSTGVRCAVSEPPSPAVRLRTEECIPVTTQQRLWLSPEWDRFLPFVRSCEVKHKNSAPIFLLSIWAREFEASLPNGAPAERLPKPILASAAGRILAHLPAGFPEDPPRSSQISFLNWVDGFPRQIRIAVSDPAVLGNRKVFLDWNPTSRTYVTREPAK